LFLRELFLWMCEFFDELVVQYETDEAEAWRLLAVIVKQMFLDISVARAPGKYLKFGANKSVGSATVLVWTSLQSIRVQNEYHELNFREHPSITPTVTLHLYSHRVPRSTFNAKIESIETALKAAHDLANKAMTEAKKKKSNGTTASP